MKRTARILSIAVPLLWCGMVAGISFIEAPTKFRAPGITLALGLGIGRLVFGLMNKVEWVFAILWIASKFMVRSSPKDVVIPIVLVLLLSLQTFWLLPHLDERAQLIMRGMEPGDTSFHICYIIGDVAKLILLLGSGWMLLKAAVKTANDTIISDPY